MNSASEPVEPIGALKKADSGETETAPVRTSGSGLVRTGDRAPRSQPSGDDRGRKLKALMNAVLELSEDGCVALAAVEGVTVAEDDGVAPMEGVGDDVTVEDGDGDAAPALTVVEGVGEEVTVIDDEGVAPTLMVVVGVGDELMVIDDDSVASALADEHAEPHTVEDSVTVSDAVPHRDADSDASCDPDALAELDAHTVTVEDPLLLTVVEGVGDDVTVIDADGVTPVLAVFEGVGADVAVTDDVTVVEDDGDAATLTVAEGVTVALGVTAPLAVVESVVLLVTDVDGVGVPLVVPVGEGVGDGDMHTASVAASGVSAPLFKRYTPPPAPML